MVDQAVKEISLSGGQMSGLMRAVLEKRVCFRFRAAGFSMTPFIRDRDVITLEPVKGRQVGVGDVVAAVNPLTGTVIVHRIVAIKGGAFVVKGDNCRKPDGIFTAERILGVARAVERNGGSVWFGEGPEKRLIGFISRSGILNRLLLPVLRRIRRGIDQGMRLNHG